MKNDLRVPVAVGHHAERAVPWTVLLAVPGLWIPGLPAWALALAFVPMYAAMALHWAAHRGRLCELCVAEMPLHGSEVADRWRRPLRTFHWVVDRMGRTALVAAAAMIGLGLLLPAAGISLFFVLVSTGLLWAMRHTRVAVWCPWCRGGGGEEEESPVVPTLPTVNA
ncbi:MULTISPECIES: hypothetical protein [unclassified Nocardiopsis]|uniref:hypothetical protein n=1 Tax=unclassified Nocardiopsis TaxID=2649073 RepID=UPI00135CB08B|nr:MULTISPECIES: hypothetical protein [unclassified Nocardiopsis]